MKNKILETMVDIIRKNPIICLATTDGKTPKVRYIIASCDENLTITCATGKDDIKVKHINANPEVHIITGHPPAEPGMPSVSIAAEAELFTDKEIREAFWQDLFSDVFDFFVLEKSRKIRKKCNKR